MDEKYMRRAIEVAKQGEEYDEVPIGCVVVKDGEIIAEAHNRKEENKSALCHAEMLALAEARAKLATGGCTAATFTLLWSLAPCVRGQ